MSTAEVDAYLAARPESQRRVLGQLRDLLKDLLPGAEEVISYAMPGFRLPGGMVAGFAGFARNCGYYPHSGQVVPLFAAELDALGFRHSTGAIRFTEDRPLPEDLVRRLVAARLETLATA